METFIQQVKKSTAPELTCTNQNDRTEAETNWSQVANLILVIPVNNSAGGKI